MIAARFDDLTPNAERAFRLDEPVDVLVARRPDEVVDVLSAAEDASRRGAWAAGFVTYEAAPGLDDHLTVRAPTDDDLLVDLPLAWFGVFAARHPAPSLEPPPAAPGLARTWSPSVSRGRYDAAVERIRELITAGETYQVNHTFRLRTRVTGDDRDLYRDLCLAQRGGYAAYLDTGRHHVLSASPELFFRIDDDRIATRPMKGTAPRGRWLEEDEEVARRLCASAKDRAENAMIVDLLRNDLGRIAIPGGVEWRDLFRAERYETLWQLTSTVGGTLRPGIALTDVFRALFPSGSVTGAPKVSTMAIIAELEDARRGVYCGAVGYLAPPGTGEPRANFNVAIRTVVVDADSRLAEYGVGGGVTFDSSAPDEYEEAFAKARVLTAARPAFELFETLRWSAHEGFRHLPEHLARMRSSASYFGFAFDEGTAAEALEATAGGEQDLRVRLLLRRGGEVRVETSVLEPQGEGPVRLAVDADPVDPTDVWLFHKTTRREAYDRRKAMRPDVDDVVLVNRFGEVTETTVANLAVRRGEAWVTPPRGAGMLAGTYREVLLREGRLIERPIMVPELRRAGDVAVVSSVRGWRPAEIVT